MKKKMLSMGLCAALTLSALCGCGNQPNASNLTAGVTRLSGTGQDGAQSDSGSEQGNSQPGNGTEQGGSQPGGSAQDIPQSADAVTATDFAVRLFQQSMTGTENSRDNILISPVSVLYALSMTANGAKGRTLAQMEEVLGASVPVLNSYLNHYQTTLPEADGYKLNIANSIWFRDDERLAVNADFLAANEKWYGADIFKAPFDDSTVKEINNWVSEATDEMIPDIVNEISVDVVMYLINGLAFDAEWETVYKKNEVWNSVFTEEDGTQYQTELMHSTENVYLQDDYAQGFLKYYKDKKYAFAALLPNEGVPLSDYVATLDGKALHEMLSNPVHTSVETAIPKFEAKYDTEMSELFIALGMTDAFDSSTADLSGIGSSLAGNLFVNRILHKTYIAVDDKGTRAGAATAVEVNDECALMVEHQVYLDRPFVYLIIDCEENVPVFIGVLKSIQ